MCGINGFNFEDKSLIQVMNRTIKYRGPDDDGFYTNQNISLGHLRLSIIDLSKKGHQPFTYETDRGSEKRKVKISSPNTNRQTKSDSLVITYNGEIYNYKEIKEELLKKGYKFKSNSDTEVILASYHEWGENCAKKFNGMWVFAIYDKNKQILFLSRDRFGKKPLYYYFKDEKFIFSSEIKALLKCNFIKREIDTKSLNEIFIHRFPLDDRTILKDVKSFSPAHNMIFDLKQNKIISYKNYYNTNELGTKQSKLSYTDSKNKLKNLIEDSVKKRMVSDVPVATFLSGGIDSSIVTYYAKKFNPNLNTYSIGFDTTNELNYAKIASEHIGTNHHEIKINKDNVLKYINDMIYHMDEPIGADPGFLPIYILSKEVSKEYKVVLSGDGADEVFTGYDRYKLLYYGSKLRHFAFFHFNNEILKRLKALRGKTPFESHLEITRVFEKEEIRKLGLKEILDDSEFKEINSKNSLNKVQIYDIKTLLPKDLFMKADKMSSAFGLEQRVPFMDYRIVEFGLNLPVKYRLFSWNEKRILKNIAKDILPKEIYQRRKHGFNVPIDYWFENILGVELKKLLKENNHNLYKKDYVLELLDSLKNTKGGFKARNVVAQKLWTIFVFEAWYKRFMK